MKSQSNILFLLIIFSCTVFFSASACADRTVIDISNNDWGLFRDFDAGWIDDDIYMPPVDVTEIPYNPPSCGWDALQDRSEKTVHLPATVEEHFWGDNGNTESVASDWRGVSWWVTTVHAGSELRGKRVFLDFESVHLRAEIFVNRTLAGYDVIGHTPFSVDVTDAIIPGGENEIAVRITDPLGNFNRVARMLGKKPSEIAITYMAKQADVVFDAIKHGREMKAEALEERLKDISIYALLTIILMEEESEKDDE